MPSFVEIAKGNLNEIRGRASILISWELPAYWPYWGQSETGRKHADQSKIPRLLRPDSCATIHNLVFFGSIPFAS